MEHTIEELREENRLLNQQLIIHQEIKKISDDQIELLYQQISEFQNHVEELKYELLEQRYLLNKYLTENIDLKPL